MSMIKKVLAEETFAPQIDPLSDSLSQNRQGRGLLHSSRQSLGAAGGADQKYGAANSNTTTIVDILYREGEKMKQKALELRQAAAKDEVKECTFKPNLLKAPKSVVPRYRGRW